MTCFLPCNELNCLIFFLHASEIKIYYYYLKFWCHYYPDLEIKVIQGNTNNLNVPLKTRIFGVFFLDYVIKWEINRWIPFSGSSQCLQGHLFIEIVSQRLAMCIYSNSSCDNFEGIITLPKFGNTEFRKNYFNLYVSQST